MPEHKLRKIVSVSAEQDSVSEQKITKEIAERKGALWQHFKRKQVGSEPFSKSTGVKVAIHSKEKNAQKENLFSVSELVGNLNEHLKENHGRVGVRGEISNFSTPQSGHFYFSLKDSSGVISAAFFRPMQRDLNFSPQDGMEVICWGKLNIYPARGHLQLVVDSIEQVGLGELAIAFQQMKTRLEAEGLFAAERKKSLPFFPRCIGLICSPTGAALQDLITVLGRRAAATSLLIAPCQVQGYGAAVKIARAIERLNRYPDVDLIILGRGGGSIEDLWAFNEEIVARAIVASKKPILSGVGHETDFTIADFVADKRAPTPSAAAELAVPEERELQQKLMDLQKKLELSLSAKLLRQRLLLQNLQAGLKSPASILLENRQQLRLQRELLLRHVRSVVQGKRLDLSRLQERMTAQSPNEMVAVFREKLLALERRLKQSILALLQFQKQRLNGLGGQLLALSPLQILERGYALVYDENKSLLRDAKELSSEQKIAIRLHKGWVYAKVDTVQTESEEDS